MRERLMTTPSAFTLRSLITDEIELREYDSLAALCQVVRDTGPDSAVRRSVHFMVWQRYDAYRRAVDMPEPPEPLAYLGLPVWQEYRRKAAAARDAYGELLVFVAP
jgi:hypothetical protein